MKRDGRMLDHSTLEEIRRMAVMRVREGEQVVDMPGLIARLLYGTGMRLIEGVRLRVKDLDLSRGEILVRDGKGSKDRVTVLPQTLVAMVVHQAIGVTQPMEALDNLRQGVQKYQPIFVILEDRFAPITA